jgi:hypothetical protein
VGWEGGGAVRVLGADPDADGRLTLAAGATAWSVRESLALGRPAPDDREDPASALLLAWILGTPDPRHVRFGRGGAVPVTVEGLDALVPRTLLLREAHGP